MTADDIGKLTLSEFEAIANRFEGAVKTIREAQALMGGGFQTPGPAPVAAPPGRPGRPPSTKLDPAAVEEARAEREAFLAMNRGPSSDEPEFPPSIAAALGGT